jgi:hypothetical protein
MSVVVTVSSPPTGEAHGVTIEEIVSGPAGPRGGVGPAGPIGPEGQAGSAGGDVITYAAGQPLSGQRCVIVDDDGLLYYADRSNPDHFNRILGITTGAVIQGDYPTVRTMGIMTESTWNWNLTKFIYLSTQGYLTQTPPSSGFLLELGWPVTETSMRIVIRNPIILA